MKALEKLQEITELLRYGGIESAEKEAERLFTKGLDMSTVSLYRDNPELYDDQLRMVQRAVDRRLKGEPFQYITGYEEFMGLRLQVGPGVLIPRPETELMAEHAIKTVVSKQFSVVSEKRKSLHSRQRRASPKAGSRFTVLDVCTGSGCLALALAKEFPLSKVYGTDISETALRYAQRSAEENNITNAFFLGGELFCPVKDMSDRGGRSLQFDLIISNPPYIRSDDISTLQTEIKDWEPIVALDGGADGLCFYRYLQHAPF
jgi:release factor glutamine methyltransferase